VVVDRRRISLPGGGAVSAVVARPAASRRGHTPAILLAPGAGSDISNPFLSAVHSGLADAGYAAVKFNFPYREAGRRAPDPRPVLERCYRAVLDHVSADRDLAPPWVVIGGKSMGGRIASHLAAAGAPVRGLLLLGYPLHPAGRPEQLRSTHLPAVTVPSLFVQGTRDSLANLELLAPIVAQMPRARLHLIEGGDHSFSLPRRAGRTDEQVWREIITIVAAWLAELQ
jgi:predicted alpha/beta-hydrolase family hydrolase